MSATDFIRRAGTKRWVVFLLVLLASYCMDIGKLLNAWFGALDDKMTWSQVPWKQKWSLYSSIAIGIGQVFLNLKSSAWATATRKEVEPAGTP